MKTPPSPACSAKSSPSTPAANAPLPKPSTKCTLPGCSYRANVRIYGGGYDDIADADVIVIAATHIWPHGEVPADRQALLGNNAAIIRQIMGDISRVTRDAVLVFITNPLDTVVYIAATEFGYPKEKIIGTGCVLDSSRLRFLLATAATASTPKP
ncbi:lactate/malate family dehydrogenase [Kingella potus]|uniref:lactate/malate family dehydrogenase n=1 Tax=Kingella potus TaxID=265175 RepID=UPI001FD03094|nr:hypothetical protein [Kingella potus]UOP01533.1 hypothetical protein LVJ84_04895 [Kingella potus]